MICGEPKFLRSSDTSGTGFFSWRGWEIRTGACASAACTGTGAGSTNYVFNGWYWDSEMETPFEGTIPDDMVGNITLYADISVYNSHN